MTAEFLQACDAIVSGVQEYDINLHVNIFTKRVTKEKIFLFNY